MKNLTICFLAIGLSFVAVDGVWAQADDSKSEDSTALEEYISRGGEPDTTTKDDPDHKSSGVYVLTETEGFTKPGGNKEATPKEE